MAAQMAVLREVLMVDMKGEKMADWRDLTMAAVKVVMLVELTAAAMVA